MVKIRCRDRPLILPFLGLLVVLMTGACGSKGGTSVRPADAASTIASAYSLPADQQACLERAFRADPAATRPLASNQPATDADLRSLGAVEMGCIQVATLASAITSGAADSFGNLDDTQRACLSDGVTALSDDARLTMLVGLVVPQSLGETWAIEMGRVTNGILDACHLTLTSSGETTVAPVPGSGPP
jgi:hypothetical protein